MKLGNTFFEYTFAGTCVVALLLINIFGKSNDPTTSTITQVLLVIIGVLVGRGTSTSSADNAVNKTGARVSREVKDTINGHIDEAMARHVPTVPKE